MGLNTLNQIETTPANPVENCKRDSGATFLF